MAKEVKGYEIRLSLNAQEVEQGLKQVGAELSAESKKLKEINQQLRYNPKSLDTWKAKQSELTKSIALTEQKLRLQNAELAEAEKKLSAGKISSSEFKSMQRSVDATETSLASLNAQLDATNIKMYQLRSMRAESLIKAGESINKLTATVIGLGTALAALEVKGAGSLATLSDNAAEAGLGAETYQRLIDAANNLGVSESVMQAGLKKTSSILADLASGNGLEAAQSLKKLGLDFKEIMKLPTDDAFKAISEALSKVTDSTQRAAIANALFGDKLGTNLLPVLSAGSDAITKLEGSATVSTDEEVASAKQLTLVLDDLKTTITSIAGTVAKEILPTVKQFQSFVETNVVPRIKSFVESIKTISPETKKLALGIAGIVASAGPVLVIVGKLAQSMASYQAAIAGVLGQSGGGGLLGLAAAHPAIAAAVALLGTAFVKGYKDDEDFRKSVNELGAEIKKTAQTVFSKVKEIIAKLKPAVDSILLTVSTIIQRILPIVTKALEDLSPVLEEIGDFLSEAVSSLAPVISKLAESLIPLIESVLKILEPVLDIVTDIFSAVSPIILNALGTSIEMISGAISTIADILKPINDIISPIADLISGLYRGIKDTVDELIGSSGLQDALKSVADFMKGIFSGVLTVFVNGWKEVVDWIGQAISGIRQFLGLEQQAQSASSGEGGNTNGIVTSESDGYTAPVYQTGGDGPLGRYRPTAADMMSTNISGSDSASSPVTKIFNITINTTADHMSIDELDRQLGYSYGG